MNRIKEDISELVQILTNDFGQDTPERMTARLESLNESNDSATKCLEDLESIQSIFPQFSDFNSMVEEIFNDSETPSEESRPFPDAWI